MLATVCKCIKRLGRAEKFIRILTAVRVGVFVAALIYAAAAIFSMLRQARTE